MVPFYPPRVLLLKYGLAPEGDCLLREVASYILLTERGISIGEMPIKMPVKVLINTDIDDMVDDMIDDMSPSRTRSSKSTFLSFRLQTYYICET